MRILIVEDDENKRAQLDAFVREYLGSKDVVEAKSYHSALAAIKEYKCDIIILDMTMPTYDITADEDGGRPQHYAGREIMRQLGRSGVGTPVVIVTQLDVFGEGASALTRSQLEAQLNAEHGHNYLGMVYYNPATDGWKNELSNKLSFLLEKEG